MRQLYMSTISISALLCVGEVAWATQPPDVVVSDIYENTAAGTNALLNVQAGYGANSAFGINAGSGITTGTNNIAVGPFAMNGGNGPSTGNDNVAIGGDALAGNRQGNANTAVGGATMLLNLNGSQNVAVGYAALNLNRSGSYNEAIGRNALLNNSVGNYNVALGGNSLFNNRASNNIAIGYEALYSNLTGAGNIAVGPGAGTSITGSDNIDIGAPGAASEDGTIRIGTIGTHSTTYISGINSSRITGAAVYVNANGQLGVLASSERYKTRVEPMHNSTQKLSELRPVMFHLKSDPQGAVQYGLIAEEVAKVYPELVIKDSSGKIQGVRYDELAPMLLNEVQKQQGELQAGLRQIAELKKQNQEILAVLATLQPANAQLARR
jgi:hypothetical protein